MKWRTCDPPATPGHRPLQLPVRRHLTAYVHARCSTRAQESRPENSLGTASGRMARVQLEVAACDPGSAPWSSWPRYQADRTEWCYAHQGHQYHAANIGSLVIDCAGVRVALHSHRSLRLRNIEVGIRPTESQIGQALMGSSARFAAVRHEWCRLTFRLRRAQKRRSRSMGEHERRRAFVRRLVPMVMPHLRAQPTAASAGLSGLLKYTTRSVTAKPSLRWTA